MKRFLNLTDIQKIELNERISTEKHTKIYKRLYFIKLKTEGLKHTEIQKQLGVSPNTCSNWLSIFFSSGFPGLCGLQYEGRRPGKLEMNKEKIRQHIEDEIVPTLTHLKVWIEHNLSISVQESWLGEWCKKNSILLVRSGKNFQENSNQKKSKKHS